MLGHVSGRRPETSDEDRPSVLDGRYRLDGVLGRGGMATVHRARDLLLERDVAVKVFPAAAEDGDDLLRNRAEIRVLATLSHPGLVTLHDAGTLHGDDGSQQVYLVMELVAGPTLAERLQHGELSVRQTVAVGKELAEALAVVHARDIVHRDIKPANVLLTGPDALDDDAAGPAVKLADFGIARLAGATRLTLTGMTLGTMSYLSPEQAAGGPLGPASDIYALGLVLLECLTGRPAFTGTPAEVAAVRLTAVPPVPEGLPPDLHELLARMTRLVPDERPTAHEVATALATVGTGPTPAATAVMPVLDDEEVATEPSGRRVRFARWGVAVGAAVLLAGGAVLVGQVAGGPGPTDAPSYPAVSGTIGESLSQLQKSVEP